MSTALPRFGPRLFWTVLCGGVLLATLFGTPVRGQSAARSPERPVVDTTQRDTTTQEAAEEIGEGPTTGTAADRESVLEQGIEILLGIFVLGPIVLFLLGLLLSFPAALLGVSLVMDGGCLRYLLFGVGWLCSLFYGLILGAIVGDLIGLEFLVQPIAHAFMWGYPVVAWWTHRKLEAMPPERYRAWDQTLTGGALLGFGAGSVWNLIRSAFTLKGGGFGGFGGGSFGGGGASGSWSGASGAVGGGASSAAGGTSSLAGMSQAAKTASVSAGAAPGVAADAADGSTEPPSNSRSWWARLRHWFQKFQWYHGLAFVLVTVVFIPLGLGTVQALQNTEFFVFVLVCVVLYSGYKLFRRSPALLDSVASFQGGEASSWWS